MTPTVVLIGMPGAGKTTTGRRLAAMLAVPFADSDELVEAATGRTVAEIFAGSGEDAFRDAEAAAIADALRGFRGVLAVGGGALTRADTRAALRASAVPVAFLRADVATLGARVGAAAGRPLLAGDPAARLAALADERQRLYADAATLVVDTDHSTPGHVAATIAARLHGLGLV